MFVDKIELVNFRNYKSLELKFSQRINIIFGDNAQGKTNILEAIYLCAAGRSHRTTKETDLINLDSDSFRVKLDIYRENRYGSVEMTYSKEQKKKISVNDIPIRRLADLMGNVTAVIFSPEDLLIIKEGPSERRKFIDMTLSQLRPSYFYDLQQYNKVLHQRNTLLKEITRKRSLLDTLDVWNNKLADIGSRIIRVRSEFTKKLDIKFKSKHLGLTNANENVKLVYAPSIKCDDFTDLQNIRSTFLLALKNSEDRELLKQSTLVGPQRDDYDIFLNGLELKLYGSQGQQRTAVLSIKLAEIDIIREETSQYPILLLDDVMSELDQKRQQYLMDNMSEIQTFITCTDKDFFSSRDISCVSFFHVENGSVEAF